MNILKDYSIEMLERVDFGIMILDEDMTILWANKFMRNAFGEIVGKKCYNVLHNADEPQELSPVFNWLKKGSGKGETEFYDPNLDRWFFVKAERLNSNILHILIDITEKMNLKKELEEREEFYRNLMEISTPLFIAQGEIFVYVNSAMADFLGYEKEELINGPFSRFVHPEEMQKLMRRYEERLKGLRGEETYPIRVRTKFGDKWAILRVKRVRFKGNNAVLGLVYDIDEIVKEKVVFEELQRILRHDIKNTLTSAFLNLELIKDGDLGRVSKLEENLIKILDLISYSADVKMKPIDVAELIEKASTGFDIELKISGNCTVLGDDLLYSVFHNIINNAVKHGKAKRVWVEIKPKRDFCEIRIANDGAEIPREFLDKIFEGVSSGGGSGKGLRFVKKTVERLGGEVWVDKNEPGNVVFALKMRTIH